MLKRTTDLSFSKNYSQNVSNFISFLARIMLFYSKTNRTLCTQRVPPLTQIFNRIYLIMSFHGKHKKTKYL